MLHERKRLYFLAAGVFSVLLFDAWLLTCGFNGCPSTAEIRAYRPSEGGRVLDRNGRLIGHLASVRRINVPLDKIPKHVRQAFLATEDRRFYTHSGIDWRGVARAVSRNVSSLSLREGFSTITMQVARKSFIDGAYTRRPLRRKLLELRMTRLIESKLTKDQILENYLNVIYLGAGVYGVEAASRDLFGKSVGNVSLSEAALLAALPKAPSIYSPRLDPDRALKRRNLVLGLMVEERYIDSVAAKKAVAARMRISASKWHPSRYDQFSAVGAVRILVDSVLRNALDHGEVVVHTTLDSRAQQAADRVINRHAEWIQDQGETPYDPWSGPPRPMGQVEGALVAMDPESGDIRALVGGRRAPRGGFNRALNARRQPGSAFKPFVYAAALAAGISPSAKVDDEPIEITQDDGTPWIPANYDDRYQGRTTLRRALMMSSNAATVRVSRVVSEQLVVAAARRNGITSPLKPHPSLALGAMEVTPLELVTAYAPFGNGGFRVTPRLVTRIETPGGRLLWSQEQVRVPAMNPAEAYEMTSMLAGVVDYGTGRVLRDYGVKGPVAGKTGTTNNGADVWFVGFTPSLVAGVWFGYDAPREIAYRAAGAKYAAPAWAEFYKAGWSERPNATWNPPQGMVSAVIDPETGDLAGEWCTIRKTEYFKPGAEPRERCEHHLALDPRYIANRESQLNRELIEELGRRLRKLLRF